jgi:hypothetical protein
MSAAPLEPVVFAVDPSQPVGDDWDTAAGNVNDSPGSHEAGVLFPDRLTRSARPPTEVAVTRSFGGLAWADGPALLLASVSAITVTAGARLLRGQDQFLMLALGIGVASATFVLDKLIVLRLNAITPRQSYTSLVLCWAPLFLFSTALATLATFSWVAPDVARRDVEQSRALHWTAEAQTISNYLVLLRSTLRRHAETAQGEIDAERRRAAAARTQGQAYNGEPLRLLQKRIASGRDLERRVSALQPLPLERPADPAEAGRDLDRVFRDLDDVHASALVIVSDPPRLPTYAPFDPPATDLQSVLAEETMRRSWRALTAWTSALWVELLPLLTLWRGGRRISLAVRIGRWRRATRDIFEALLGRREPDALPIVIEPLHVRGVVRVALAAEYTLSDCSPLLEEAVDSLAGMLGSYQLRRVSTLRGESLDEDVPLLPQLRGEPLVLSVVEDRQ